VEAGEKKIIDKVIKKHKAGSSPVVSIFQDIQELKGYLSEYAVRYVSEKLGISASQAFSVATFYSAFSLIPQGRNRIQICLGTACHIKGAENIAGRITRHLNLNPGETTKDGKFSFKKVRCLGCCALAPVLKVNNETYANMSQERISAVLEKY
jgi:NADH:ubiquinone oxidoreductase subunit E